MHELLDRSLGDIMKERKKAAKSRATPKKKSQAAAQGKAASAKAKQSQTAEKKRKNARESKVAAARGLPAPSNGNAKAKPTAGSAKKAPRNAVVKLGDVRVKATMSPAEYEAKKKAQQMRTPQKSKVGKKVTHTNTGALMTKSRRQKNQQAVNARRGISLVATKPSNKQASQGGGGGGGAGNGNAPLSRSAKRRAAKKRQQQRLHQHVA